VNLGSRYWHFSSKASWLVRAFSHATSLPADVGCRDAHTLAREAATICLQDQWSAFCRDLIFKSWRGKVWTAGGTYLTPNAAATSHTAVLIALRATYTGKQKKAAYWQPKWFDPIQTIESAKRLALPNLPSIAAGVGLTPSPLDELRAVRNYFAHRGPEGTSRLAPFVGGPVTDLAVHSLVTQSTLGGGYRFERWVAQLDTMARTAVQ